MRRQFVQARCEVGASDLRRAGSVYYVDPCTRGAHGQTYPGRCIVTARHGDPIVSAAQVRRASRAGPTSRRQSLRVQGMRGFGAALYDPLESGDPHEHEPHEIVLTQDTRFCIPLGLLALPILAVGVWAIASRGK